MAVRRVIVCVVLIMLVLVPALGLAGDDLSGPQRAGFHVTGLRHQPARPWRTIAAAIEPHIAIPRIVSLATLDDSEPSYPLPLIVRTRFIPPRG
jgi:hypothetical protein